jgi:hypothetical protein
MVTMAATADDETTAMVGLQQPPTMRAWFRDNLQVLLVLGVVAVAGFAVVGLLSSDSRVAGINVTGFDQTSALVFLSAFGQLILAIAIWDQIRSARESARAATRGITISTAAADAAARSADSAGKTVDLAIADRNRASLLAEAEVLTEFLAHASTTAARFKVAAPTFEAIINRTGERRAESQRSAIPLARSLEDAAERVLVGYYHVLVTSGDGSEAERAGAAFRDAVEGQQAAMLVLLTQPVPDPEAINRLQIDQKPLQDACVRVARDIRRAADDAVRQL